jgi:uncharacterized protein
VDGLYSDCVLVLLPPSEGKYRPRRGGSPVDLDALSFPGLTDLRKLALTELIAVSGRPDALPLLRAGASLHAEVTANQDLWTAPTAPASRIYSGVLYDALGWATLDAGAKRRGGRQVLIASALWGWLRPQDRVPAYRLSMDGDLPGLVPLARHWRAAATAALIEAAGPQKAGLIIDCRSAPYAAAAPIPPELAHRAVAVRVLREQDGQRTVVSHLAKHTRGEITRHLLTTGPGLRRPQQLPQALAPAFVTELTEPTAATRPWTASIILPG